jgi:hypothetical protein
LVEQLICNQKVADSISAAGTKEYPSSPFFPKRRIIVGDEARRFLRYIVPGLVYGVTFLSLMLIVLLDPTIDFLASVTEKNGLGLAATGVLASGGLGYIFAAIHHGVHWYFPCDQDVFDHRTIVGRLQSAGLVSPTNEELRRLADRTTLSAIRESRITAQTISLIHWYRHLETRKAGKDQIDNLGNQAHSLGTTRIAAIFALLSAVAVCANYGRTDLSLLAVFRYILMIATGICLSMLFHTSYRRVARFSQDTYDEMLMNAMQDSSKASMHE